MTINVENMRAWVVRLRDPNANQATGRLRDPNDPTAMCCLGHACDISDIGHWVSGEDDESDDFYLVDDDRNDYSATSLPVGVSIWLGLTSEDQWTDGDITHDPELLLEPDDADQASISVNYASSLNDTWNYTLEQIADAIERTWPEVKR